MGLVAHCQASVVLLSGNTKEAELMSGVQYLLGKRPVLALLLRTSSTSRSGTHFRDLFLQQAPLVSPVLQTLSEQVLVSVQRILARKLLYPFSELKQLLAGWCHEASGVFV